MKYKAVIFDLFGTLVGDIMGPPYTDVLKRIGLPLKKESSCNVRLELKIKGVNHGQEIAFSRGDYQQVARS